MHTLVHAQDPDPARAFFVNVLDWPHVDAHDGWLIFGDDLEQTVAELTARGARFAGTIENPLFGRTIAPEVPGAGHMTLYQPRHPTALDL